MILAVELKNHTITKFLLSIPDVDVNVKSFTEILYFDFFNGISPLHIAILHADTKIINEFQKRKDTNYAIRTNVLFFGF